VQLAGISVDPPERGAGMASRLLLPFPLLSDARGELARLWGLWNEEEHVAVPSIVALDASGTVRYLYAGEDFADRPEDEEVFATLDGLVGGGRYGETEPRVHLTPKEAREQSVRPDRPAMSLEELSIYYRALHFATVALKRRFGRWGPAGKEAFREVDRYQRMVREYRGAIRKTLEMKKTG